MQAQFYWACCKKCGVLWYPDSRTIRTRCAAGGDHERLPPGTPQPGGPDPPSENYQVLYDVPEDYDHGHAIKHQNDWRCCSNCAALFFDGFASKGTCPAGGAHVAQGFNYGLLYDAQLLSNWQGDWRYCQKCGALHHDFPQAWSFTGVVYSRR